MTIKRKTASAALGFIVGVLVCLPFLKRSYMAQKAFSDRFKQEREAIWKAAGVVAERMRRGDYNSEEEARMDFDFERIRFMEESLAAKTTP